MTELTQHLSAVKKIIVQLYNQIGMEMSSLPAPTDKYYQIHLDDNQKHNSKITYPPILISKDFKIIQTNVGLLSTAVSDINNTTLKEIETTLPLMEYNNYYYYVDTEESMKSLENYYSPKFIEKEWNNITL
jgi:hypothetical protein